MPVNARRDVSTLPVSGSRWVDMGKQVAYMRRSMTETPRLIFNNESRMLSDTKASRELSVAAPRSSAAKNAVGSMIASTLSIWARKATIGQPRASCREHEEGDCKDAWKGAHPVIKSDGLRDAWCGCRICWKIWLPRTKNAVPGTSNRCSMTTPDRPTPG